MNNTDKDNHPIWRGTRGIPMHSHSMLIDGIYIDGEFKPCLCGDRSYDIPLSAVQTKEEKEGKNE